MNKTNTGLENNEFKKSDGRANTKNKYERANGETDIKIECNNCGFKQEIDKRFALASTCCESCGGTNWLKIKYSNSK